jgi:sialate O-acetylesterase
MKHSMILRDVALLLCTFQLLATGQVAGQTRGEWHGAQCAVVLTYDDALNVHLDNVVPALDSLGLKGTFYLSGFFPSFRARVAEWSVVAQHGHELGNHTLFHPCDATQQGREWVPLDYRLDHYTVRRMVDEITMANALLESIDGRKERTFAYPCGDKKAGDSSYVGDVMRLFPGARGVEGKMQRKKETDLSDIGSYLINGQTGDELIRLVREAMEKKALLVFLFHGVGGEHGLNVSLEAHRELIAYLHEQRGAIWVAPLIDVVRYLKDERSGTKK